MPGLNLRLVAATIGALMATSACSTTIPGTPVADSSAAGIRLDTGNFPTTPRKITAGTPIDAWVQESWRMADGVVEPWSIDPELTQPVSGEKTYPLVSPLQIGVTANGKYRAGGWPQVFTQQQVAALTAVPFLGGFLAQAADSATAPSRILAVGMLRFADAATAAKAANALVPTTTPLPSGFPAVDGARVLTSASTTRTPFAAITLRGDLMLIAHARATTQEAASSLVGKALAAEASKAASGYKPTPYPGVPPLLVDMDRDGIMSRTLPSSTSNDEAAVYGVSPNGSLMYGYRTPYAKALNIPDTRAAVTNDVNTYGLDLETIVDTHFVYRMRDASSASRKLTDKYPEPSPNGRVSGLAPAVARCGKVEGTVEYRCAVAFGRYFAEVASPTLQAAKQAAAAQYLILKNAG